MLTVSVDGYVFENNFQIGIWRMFYEVMRRTAAQVDYTLWLRSPPMRPIPKGVIVVQDHGRNYGHKYDLVARTRRLWAVRNPPRAVAQADVFHTTYFTRPPMPGPAYVVSVYDMIAESLFPICGDWAPANTLVKRDAIDSADVTLCISHATTEHLHRFYPKTFDTSRVVQLGADHLATPAKADEGLGVSGYVLFVGNRGGYKNFWTVADAVGRQEWPTGVSLVVVGPEFDDLERRLLESLRVDDRIRHLGRVSDDELGRLYRHARCLVFPSLLEGFGLPLLEAQVNHCPVLCSDITVFREVAGDAAIYFDPRLGERIADAVGTVGDPAVRRRLIEAGIENTKRFTWDRASVETLAVYREAAALQNGRAG